MAAHLRAQQNINWHKYHLHQGVRLRFLFLVGGVVLEVLEAVVVVVP